MFLLFAFHFLVELLNSVFWAAWATTFAVVGIEIKQISLILAALFLSQALFEIPTGFFADRFGRKQVTLVGVLLTFAGFLIVGRMQTFHSAVLGFFVAGLGQTLMSGARTAWMLSAANAEMELIRNTASREFPVPVMKAYIEGETHGWERVRKKFFIVLNLILCVTLLFGPILSLGTLRELRWHFWTVLAFGTLATFFVGCFLPGGTHNRTLEEGSFRGFHHEVFAQFKRVPVFFIMLSAAFCGVENGIRSLAYQPFILEITHNQFFYLGLFQILLAVGRFSGALTYMYSGVDKHPRLASWLLFLPLVVLGLSELSGLYAMSYWVYLSFFVVALFCMGWYFPVREFFFNEVIPERLRSTLISLDSTIFHSCSTIALLWVHYSTFPSGNLRRFWLPSGISLILGSVALGVSVLWVNRQSAPRSAPAAKRD